MAETVETLTERLRGIVEAYGLQRQRTPEQTGFRDLIEQARDDLFTVKATVRLGGKDIEVVQVEGTEFLRIVTVDGKTPGKRTRNV